MSARISIKIHSPKDKSWRKLNHRANKNHNRAKRARNLRRPKVNKPEHTQKESYKPRSPSPPRQTKSYETLTMELKKIEDDFIRSWEDF